VNDGLFEDRHRDHICEWIRANGLDPGSIPAHSTVTVAGGTITYTVWLKDDKGKLNLGPDRRPIAETRTSPLVVEPDDVVRQWLLPRCPTCGR
jgi:hypothetical protein